MSNQFNRVSLNGKGKVHRGASRSVGEDERRPPRNFGVAPLAHCSRPRRQATNQAAPQRLENLVPLSRKQRVLPQPSKQGRRVRSGGKLKSGGGADERWG